MRSRDCVSLQWTHKLVISSHNCNGLLIERCPSNPLIDAQFKFQVFNGCYTLGERFLPAGHSVLVKLFVRANACKDNTISDYFIYPTSLQVSHQTLKRIERASSTINLATYSLHLARSTYLQNPEICVISDSMWVLYLIWKKLIVALLLSFHIYETSVYVVS